MKEQQKGRLRSGGDIGTFPESSPISLCVIDKSPFFTKILTVDPEGKIATSGILRENPPGEAEFKDIRETLEEINTQLNGLDPNARQDKTRRVSWMIGAWRNPIVQATA